jgi:cytochrome c553
VRRLRKGRWALRLTAFFTSALLSAFCGAQDVALCTSCHGPDGNSITPGVPSIAGQPKLFMENQLVLLRDGMRESEQMFAALKGMKDPELIKLAAHFSKLPAKPAPAGSRKWELWEKGRNLAAQHRCGICHLPDFSGQNQVPRLASQREEYLLAEMRAYRDNKRKGGDTIMAAALYGVADPDLVALAHYLAQGAGRPPTKKK